MNNTYPEEEQPGTPRHTHPLLNIDRDMENQARRRNERNQNNNVNPRDRLFHALFMKIGHLYLRVVPRKFRIFLEIMVLLKGLFLFSVLTYLHFSFGRTPLNCLNATEGSWPKDGILRVQIKPEVRLKQQIPMFFSSEENRILFHPCHNENSIYSKDQCAAIAKDMKSFYNFKSNIYRNDLQCYRMNLSDFMIAQQLKDWKQFESFEYVMTDKRGNTFKGFKPGDIINEASLLTFYDLYLAFSEPERHYIFEYSQEFGFLRLSQETRKRLKIPVKVVSLDPNKEKCLGDRVSHFILKYFLGYDDIIMNSIKKIADKENNTGFMLNVMTGDHYKFVSWGIGRSSYFISLLLMFLFTISISTLLRYCHQQVFFFIIHVLRMMDMNVVLAFPIAPLFTVILSLVGMETIMSEYFNDTTTSFYIILIVWAVDQFDTICCHTTTSQKYWLRFFYLYHFIFYAYHYRFNGQYSSLALAATWFLIQHSMLYFFHNYELPAIEDQLHGRRDEEAYLDEAVQMIVEGIEMVAGQNHNNREADAAPDAPENPENPENQPNTEHQNNTENTVQVGADDSTRVREISTTDNGNRVFVFSGEGPFIQMVRDFIRQVHHRVNATGGAAANETGDLPTASAVLEGTASTPLTDYNERTVVAESELDPLSENSEGVSALDVGYSESGIAPELDAEVRRITREERLKFFNEISATTTPGAQGVLSVDTERRADEERPTNFTRAELHADTVYHQVQAMPGKQLQGARTIIKCGTELDSAHDDTIARGGILDRRTQGPDSNDTVPKDRCDITSSAALLSEKRSQNKRDLDEGIIETIPTNCDSVLREEETNATHLTDEKSSNINST